MKLSILGLGITVDALGIDAKDASNFLSRERRSNSNKYFGSEELVEGDIISECYEEDCSQSEAIEAIENIQYTGIFWKYRHSPCDTFNMCDETGTESCIDERPGNSEDFTCVCKEGYAGPLCTVNCDGASEKPLTLDLSPSAYSASGSYNSNFSPSKGLFGTNIDYVQMQNGFDVQAGGFPYVWMSQKDGPKWLEIDLGNKRTVTEFVFRSGHYQGRPCFPTNIKIEIRKDNPSEEVADDDIIELSFELNEDEEELAIQPQSRRLQNIYFGQYVRFVAETDEPERPVCFAVEIKGRVCKNCKSFDSFCTRK